MLWFQTRSDSIQTVQRHNMALDLVHRKVQVGKDQEKAQSEKDSHSKNRGYYLLYL